MALRFQAALDAVLNGDAKVSLKVQHNEEDNAKVMAKFMDSFDSTAHPVDWEYVNAKFAPPDSYMKQGGEDGKFDSYIVSRLPNVTSILLRQGINDMTCIVGLTSCKDDDMTFPNGQYIKLGPGQAFKRAGQHGGPSEEDFLGNSELKSHTTFDEEFLLIIREHHIHVLKNEEDLDDLGFTSQASMYVKIFLCEETAMVRIRNTTTTPQTKAFDFNGNLIGDQGLTRLAPSLALDTSLVAFLDLSLNRISVTGVESLATALESGFCKVATLILNHNDIGDEATTRLSQVLQHHSSPVRELGLIGCDIGDEGALSLSKVLALKACRLTAIELAYNRIGDEGVDSLAWALEQEDCRLKV
eukprot:CAMPEP_0178441912 /NCGR_PEP_ID=MMETSP0689_2-20121128/37813_1 /TAXON_ID=160604 /ORGANISM="Amphidinium massartii, Strain CS-259" /LENGTH=356 /DNA_ID=CAMNT_0020065281 /DNA_START=78 /DNA_END=1145 /DNA_ORIENTATION=-